MAGEVIYHFNGVRLGIKGSGDLKLTMLSIPDDDGNQLEQELVSYELLPSLKIQPTRLANFKQQRAQLELKMTEKDDYFNITRIIVFAKPLFTSYPG